MSVAFGFSFGDFVAAIGIVVDLVAALSETRGVSAEIRLLVTELNVLITALTAVNDLKLEDTDPHYGITRQAVGECLHCIGEFINGVEKYMPLHEIRKSLREYLLKMKWALCHKEDVEKFRTKLAAQVAALNLLLITITLSRTTVAGAKTAAQLDEQSRIVNKIHEQLQRSDSDHVQLLHKIESLVAPPQYPGPESVPPNFEVPLILMGAPVIAKDHVIERTEVMSAIEDVLLPYSNTQKSIAVLQGMGGIGKSQLARSFAYEHQKDYTAIFWLNAKTEGSLRLGIAQLAEQIPLFGVLDASCHIGKDDSSITAASRAVITWLSHQANTGWLLILDNVDNQVSEDTEEVDDTQSHSRSLGKQFDATEYIPQTSHGSVLMTSRLSFLDRAFGAVPIFVNEMSEEEGIALLCKASRRLPEEAGILPLVNRLGAHPLALSQAGRYICDTHTSFSSYLQEYNKRFKILLERRPRSNEYHNGSIAATLGLSFSQLIARNSSAAALLMVFSCLDNSNISFELFEALSNAKTASLFATDDLPFDPDFHWIPDLPDNWLNRLCEDENIYLEAIASLHELSFIRHNDQSAGISIHPLIHEWSLRYYDSLSSEYSLAATCNILGAGVPQSEPYFKGLPLSHIQPHIDRWYSLLPPEHDMPKASIGSILAIGEYYAVQGPAERAYAFRQLAYKNAISRFEADHRCRAEAGIAIASSHIETERWEEAITWLEKSHAGYRKIYWPQSGSSPNENEKIADILVASLLILCNRALNRQDAAQDAVQTLEVLMTDLEDSPIYPVAAWLYYILQIAVTPSAEDGEARARLEKSIQYSEKLLHAIQGASLWPVSLGSREFAEMNLFAVLGKQYIDHGEIEKGRGFLQRALELNEGLAGPSSPDTLALARQVAYAPLTMRRKLWRSTMMDALRSTSKKNDFGIVLEKQSTDEKSTAHNLWARLQWKEATATVWTAIQNRPKG